MVEKILFYAFASIMIISAILMVTTKNIFYSALYLGVVLFSVAGIFVLLNAYFLAGIQVLIYIGAVLVLAIFVINLTKEITGRNIPQHNKQIIPAIFVSLLTLFLIITSVLKTDMFNRITHWIKVDKTALIGRLLLTDYVIPFEVASVLLLAGLIGAIVIISREDKK